MILTTHAQNRMRQRGTPPLTVELLMAYGRIEYQNGSQLLYFDNRRFKRVRKELNAAIKNIEKLARTYLVIGENGQIITTGHRTQQIKRK